MLRQPNAFFWCTSVCCGAQEVPPVIYRPHSIATILAGRYSTQSQCGFRDTKRTFRYHLVQPRVTGPRVEAGLAPPTPRPPPRPHPQRSFKVIFIFRRDGRHIIFNYPAVHCLSYTILSRYHICHTPFHYSFFTTIQVVDTHLGREGHKPRWSALYRPVVSRRMP